MVEEGEVRRITVGEGSHKYDAAPAKNLVTPNLNPGATGLRFEIGTDGKVGQIHVGQLSALAYVDGFS